MPFPRIDWFEITFIADCQRNTLGSFLIESRKSMIIPKNIENCPVINISKMDWKKTKNSQSDANSFLSESMVKIGHVYIVNNNSNPKMPNSMVV